jgi:DNA-binding NarL/FixJ family response regulator
MRVALADDSALFRRGLALLLAAVGVDVVLQAASADELLARLPAVGADIVVIDIRMPPTFEDEGLVAALDIRTRHPQLGILVLSTYTDTTVAMRLLEHAPGRVGYLLKDHVSDASTFRESLDRIHRGETVIDPGIVRQLIGRQRELSVLDRLSPRELRVLELLAEGRSNAGIGRELYIGAKTVERYIANVFTQLGLEGRADDNRRVLATLAWLRAQGAPT